MRIQFNFTCVKNTADSRHLCYTPRVLPARMRVLPLLPERYGRRIVAGCFAMFLAAGLLSFRDFGIATDEGTMDALGHDAYQYVFHGAQWPTNPAWRYHGTMIELPMQIIENLVADRDDKATQYKRVFTQHFVVFLSFLAGLAALYALAKKHFGDWRWALLCTLFLFLTPRFFAHAFYNSRDIPMLALFTLSMLTLVRAAERKTVLRVVLHAAATGAALALRMPSLIILVLTALVFGMDILRRHIAGVPLEPRRTASLLALYVACVALFTVAFWPFLWEDPIGHFLEAYRFMRSLGGQTVFMGHTFDRLPWGYIPLWMALTIPVVYSLLWICGIAGGVAEFVRRPKALTESRLRELLFLAWLFLPILSIFVTGAGIYNEWRHVFFIYPAFLLLAVSGLKRIVEWGQARRPLVSLAACALVCVQLLATGAWMLRNHSFSFAYFSLPSTVVDATLQPDRVDYWGLSYYALVGKVLRDEKNIVSVYATENIAYQNTYNVYTEAAKRMILADTLDDAMYALYASTREAPSGLQLVYAPTVDGHVLSALYRGPVKEIGVDPVNKLLELRR
jgi:hypothetical protein